MVLKPVNIEISDYPSEIRPFLINAKVYDSSCSEQAKVIFIDKDNGYFLKVSEKNTLKREADLTNFFYEKGLSAQVLVYVSTEEDYFLTRKIQGDDCIAQKYLEQPEKLCDKLAETLLMLHNTDFTGCPVDHISRYLNSVEKNYLAGMCDKLIASGFSSRDDAYNFFVENAYKLEPNALLHGDPCLPNIILNDWKFSGFIDLGGGGIGDRHVDIFWAIWTFKFNLKTDKYRERFIDAYGRDKIDEEKLRIVMAAEIFG
ncbi:MAG: phosphotransferase [Defluviitaleaceae bacterium]|nr:phosphotransferase [Defluviitaleaceae bacterium]